MVWLSRAVLQRDQAECAVEFAFLGPGGWRLTIGCDDGNKRVQAVVAEVGCVGGLRSAGVADGMSAE